jgi:hypothetical protein
MNIRTNEAGSVEHSHILSKGFEVFNTIGGNDMGQMEWEIPQYTNGKLKITGGYWNWIVTNMKNEKLWEGWWNTNEEFDKIIGVL